MCKYEILDSVDCMHAPNLVEKFEEISFPPGGHGLAWSIGGESVAQKFYEALESRIFKNSIEHCAYGGCG
jgi:hypothetical protein